MKVSLTIFQSIYDNKTHRRMDFDTFLEFETLLYTLSKVEIKAKKDAQLISPATYKQGEKRRNVNVLNWAGWVAVDVDDVKIEGKVEDYVRNNFNHYNFVCYSTAGSTHKHPKFRLVFPTTREILPDEIRPFWHALNTELGSIGDIQTKDFSRLYYIPATYSGAFNFIFSNHVGNDIDPSVLISKHPLPPSKTGNSFFDNLPPEMQDKIVDHRKAQMDNTTIRWSSYKDCPFFPQNAANEYKSISDTGWYHKMYIIMVSIASKAIEKKYPITAHEIAELCSELDRETGGWYERRPLEMEANRALEYAYRNATI